MSARDTKSALQILQLQGKNRIECILLVPNQLVQLLHIISKEMFVYCAFTFVIEVCKYVRNKIRVSS